MFEILSRDTGKIFTVEVAAIEFFKETLSSIPTGIPNMQYVKINQFNQKTGDDLLMLINYFKRQGLDKLVIDVRGNAGGPPLAAREIANMFFPPNTDLFYFQKKNQPKIILRTLPTPVNFSGEIAVLIDKGSGSASELFAGTMQKHNRAILIGAEQSAGKTFLKSMFEFEDKSMLYLVTSLAYLYNGQTYNGDGLKPDFIAKGDVDLFGFVSKCLDTYYAK